MLKNFVLSTTVVLALGFAACDDVPTTPPVNDSEAVFDPAFDVTLPPDGGTCPNVFYESSEVLSNGVTVTWTSVLAGFDYTEGEDYVADVMWSVDPGGATYVDFTGRNGPNTWTPRRIVDGVMTPGVAGEGTLPVTVSMSPMHATGDGQMGNGHFWLRLDVDDGEGMVRKVKLGVNFHLEDPAEGAESHCPTDDPPVDLGNQPPTANAGGNQTVTDTDDGGDEAVTLDGSGSADPDGTIATWAWTENAAEIATGESPLVTFAVGVHTVTLTVTDNEGATDTDQVVITVNAPAGNQPPTANAGANQTVTDTDDGGDEAVTLDGSGSSDPDGTIASWVWTENAAEIATGESPLVTFAVGTHTVTLTVTDNEGATDTDNVVITVDAAPSGVSFAADIQPYFQSGAGNANCVMCHSGGGGPKGVNLDSYANIMAGGDDGPLVVPFDSADPNALLVPQLEANHNNGPDDAGFVVILKQWIDAGAQNN